MRVVLWGFTIHSNKISPVMQLETLLVTLSKVFWLEIPQHIKICHLTIYRTPTSVLASEVSKCRPASKCQVNQSWPCCTRLQQIFALKIGKNKFAFYVISFIYQVQTLFNLFYPFFFWNYRGLNDHFWTKHWRVAWLTWIRVMTQGGPKVAITLFRGSPH